MGISVPPLKILLDMPNIPAKLDNLLKKLIGTTDLHISVLDHCVLEKSMRAQISVPGTKAHRLAHRKRSKRLFICTVSSNHLSRLFSEILKGTRAYLPATSSPNVSLYVGACIQKSLGLLFVHSSSMILVLARRQSYCQYL